MPSRQVIHIHKDAYAFFNLVLLRYLKTMTDAGEYGPTDKQPLMTPEEAEFLRESLEFAVEQMDNGDFSERGVLGAVARMIRDKRDFEAPFN